MPDENNRIEKLTTVISVSLIFALASFTVIAGVAKVPAPYMHVNGENFILASAWGLVNGHGLYRLSELNKVPVFFSGYAPMIYLVTALSVKIWGITYVPGRLFMILAMLGCAGMIGAIARRQGCTISASVIGGLLFLGTSPVFQWSGVMRADFLAIFFELAAVFILLGEDNSLMPASLRRGQNDPVSKLVLSEVEGGADGSRVLRDGFSASSGTREPVVRHSGSVRRSIAFVLFGVLAGFTKQQAFGLVVGALLGLFLTGDSKQKKRIFILGLAYALTAILAFAVIEAVTKGGFHKFVVGSFRSRAYWGLCLERVLAIFSDPLNAAVAVLGIIGVIREKKSLWLAPVIALPFALAIRLEGIRGGSYNYFIEPMAACGIGAAFLLTSTAKAGKARNWAAVLICAILALSCVGSAFVRKASLEETVKSISEYKSLSQPDASVLMMKNTVPPGSMVLTQFPDLPLFAGCVPAMSDPFMLTMMAQDDKWDQTPVINAIKEKRIAIVLMKDKVTTENSMLFLTKEMAAAILDNYELVPIYVEKFYLYVPRGARP